MDAMRAREIASSPDMINVSYNGTRIYIEKINESNGTARIHSLDNPDTKIDVPLSSLIEQ